MQELSFIKNTSGKITILTGIVGLGVFLLFFLVNVGTQELQRAAASDIATTSITVLNTPPAWTVDAEEDGESSATNPTNSGDEIAWIATATDPSNQPYFLLICEGATPPIAASSSDYASLGTAPPSCAPGVTQWAVSASTTSGEQARAATTTLETAPFVSGDNIWYAWVCDDDPILPRCNAAFTQGTGVTASPFNVNFRPVIDNFYNDGPQLPGDVITFTASTTEPESDEVRIFVCTTNVFSTSTLSCAGDTLASSTLQAENPSAGYTIFIPTQDDFYDAFAFVLDEHDHLALPLDIPQDETYSQWEVANAAPTVSAVQINLNNGSSTMILTEPEAETTGFQLSFIVSDNNSCQNTTPGPEIVDYQLAIFRTDAATNTSATCSPESAHNPNNCYPSEVDTSVWNLNCTASTTSCTFADDGIDTTQQFDCTFPLWHIADPTTGGSNQTFYFDSSWSASVRGIDDNGATSTLVTAINTVDVQLLSTFALNNFAIPYGQLEPGQFTPTLIATTSFRATGNAGIDQELTGQSMCEGYSPSTPCPFNASSTIPEDMQAFGTSSIQYSTATTSGNVLSSTTPSLLELSIAKNTATSSSNSELTYWGIMVPIEITVSGVYTGENTITGLASHPSRWGL